MKTLEIIGFKRANLGKTDSSSLRLDSNVPCVLYGGKTQVHFHTPMFLFRDLVYTGNVHKVKLTVDGKSYDCILQDIQFHPVNDMIMHADFLELVPGKEVKFNIPVAFEGVAPGVLKGGKLVHKIKKLTVKALPENLPDTITVNIDALEIGKSIKVGDVKSDKYEVMNGKNQPICTVDSTRSSAKEAVEESKGKK